jgi:hypothetical protein
MEMRLASRASPIQNAAMNQILFTRDDDRVLNSKSISQPDFGRHGARNIF